MQDAWIPLVTDLLAEGCFVLNGFAEKREGEGTKGRSSVSGVRVIGYFRTSFQLASRKRMLRTLDNRPTISLKQTNKQILAKSAICPQRRQWVAHTDDSSWSPGHLAILISHLVHAKGNFPFIGPYSPFRLRGTLQQPPEWLWYDWCYCYSYEFFIILHLWRACIFKLLYNH